MRTGPTPPPLASPIGWQPTALSPAFAGVRSLGPPEGAPVPLRIFFPSLERDADTAPVLQGCGRYPLVVLAHGHCAGDPEHYRRWARIPAQLARAGYVVAVPLLAGIAGGASPSVSGHPDEATLDSVATWARTAWEHADVLLPPPATGVVGHGHGALLGATFARRTGVSAFAGLSGGWQHWFGDEPFPLTLLDVPSLLVWGGPADPHTHLPDAVWQAMARPRHRVVFTSGEHWDYLGPDPVPGRAGMGPCPHVAAATADLLTMFLARYLPPELATHLADAVPASLEPPVLRPSALQEPFTGDYLGGWDALSGHGSCGVAVDNAVDRLVANSRSKETHSVEHPCRWVGKISMTHLWVVTAKPAGYHWCEYCFPTRAYG